MPSTSPHPAGPGGIHTKPGSGAEAGGGVTVNSSVAGRTAVRCSGSGSCQRSPPADASSHQAAHGSAVVIRAAVPSSIRTSSSPSPSASQQATSRTAAGLSIATACRSTPPGGQAGPQQPASSAVLQQTESRDAVAMGSIGAR